MKYLCMLAVLSVFAPAQTMSPQQHLQLHPYNQRPSLRNEADKRAHRMHIIEEKEAKTIAEKVCHSDDVKLILTHHDIYLYYIAVTPTCTAYINAMDGSILTPEQLKKGAK